MNRSQDRRSLWRAGIVQIVALLVYVGIVEVIVSTARPNLSGAWLAVVALLLALIPAAIWLSFFYAQDRLEPEPRHFVLGVAVLGALLAAAVGEPILSNVFNIQSWLGTDTLTEILGSTLIVGFTHMFLIYATVRYSIYYSTEFDQRVDGVVYGTAAGVGYATMLNIDAIVGSRGLDLSAAVIRVVVTALVYSTLGGLLGYFIARTKFDAEPAWWMPAGLTAAALTTGVFLWLRGQITQTPVQITASGVSGGYNPWPALVAGVILAGALLALVFYLMRRSNELTLAGADTDQA